MKQILTTDLFDEWFVGLRDIRAKVRIHFGPGHRVYFAQRGSEVVILLAGGDKSSQPKDIKRALDLARRQ